MARAACGLRHLRARWIYNKTDSVLRGNVTHEVEAVIQALGLDGVLLVPANPSLGRTIEGGRYFVRGRPLHETEFARDPRHQRVCGKPVRTGDSRVFVPGGTGWRDPCGTERLSALVSATVAALQSGPRAVLHVGLPRVEDVAVAGTLALHLVRVATQVIHRAGVDYVLVEGGGTTDTLARLRVPDRRPAIRHSGGSFPGVGFGDAAYVGSGLSPPMPPPARPPPKRRERRGPMADFRYRTIGAASGIRGGTQVVQRDHRTGFRSMRSR